MTRQTFRRSTGGAVCALWIAALPAAAQTPTATLTQWDVYAATGGQAVGTRNPAAIVRDPAGAAGPAGAVWVAAQSPDIRVGRLDPAASVNNYIEWAPAASDPGGAPLGIVINGANGDVWVSIQGEPAFLLKVKDSNTFRRYRGSGALVTQGVAIAGDGSLIAAFPDFNAYGHGRAIAKIPRDLTSTQVTATTWRFDLDPVGEPRSVAVDASGDIWYTDNLNNLVARLNPSTNVATEWALPAGSNPVGLQISASSVCVVSDGLVPKTGIVQCLNPSTNQITQFAQVSGAGLNRPQQLARNSFGELFVTEWSGNAVVFIGEQAYQFALTHTVTPVTRTRARGSLTLYTSSVTAAPVVRSVAPTTTTLTGIDVGNGQARYNLPTAALSYPFAMTGYPQPFGITAAFNDTERGSGTAFIAEYFSGPIGDYSAGRISRVEVLPPRVIDALPSTLTFAMTAGGAAPSSKPVSVSEGSGLSLSWTATVSQPWLSVAPASGSAPSSVNVSVNPAGLAIGTYTGVVTFDDGAGPADPETVAVTFTIEAAPVLAASASSLAFSAAFGGTPSPASQSFTVANTGGGTIDCAATADQPWISVVEDVSCAFTVTLNAPPTAAGVYTGAITITSPGASSAAVAVAFTRDAAPPAIEVLPLSLTFNVLQSATAPVSQTVFVRNTGGQPLTWSPSVTSGGSWLAVSADTTNIPPGDERTLTVTVNPVAVPGSTSGEVTIATNAVPATTLIAVAVTRLEADSTPPVLTLPADIIAEAAGASGAPVSYSASAEDDIDGAVTASCSPASGSTFSLGATTVNCSAVDAANNTAAGAFTVTVSDTTAPTLSLPSPVTVSATSAAGAAVTYAASASDLVSGSVTPVCSPASGSTFPIAVTTVTCTATDGAENSASGSFTVTVRDTSPPTLQLPTIVPVPATSAAGAVVTYSVTATDPIGTAPPTVSCAPASGTTFPIGTTQVNCTATDAAGNTASGSFAVTVSPPPASMSLAPSAVLFKTGRLAYCNGLPVGPNWKDQGVVLTNTGGSSLSFAASTPTPWVRVTPTSGSLAPGASATLTVSVDLSGLPRGNYSGAFTVVGNGTLVQTVPVSLEIGNALPTLCLTPKLMSWGQIKSSATSTTQAFDVTNVGDDPMANWSSTRVATDGSISMSATKGAAPKTITVSVKTGRKKGAQSGAITITVPGAVEGTQQISLSWSVQ